jgi:hypothetical protein
VENDTLPTLDDSTMPQGLHVLRGTAIMGSIPIQFGCNIDMLQDWCTRRGIATIGSNTIAKDASGPPEGNAIDDDRSHHPDLPLSSLRRESLPYLLHFDFI